MKAIAAQAALPRVVGQGQHFLDIGQRVVEGRVKTGHLGQAGRGGQQRLDGFQRERLVQGRQRDVGLEVGQHGGVHAHRVEVFGAAMHHAVRHGGDAVAAQAGQNARADVLQRGMVGLGAVQRHRAGHHAGFAKGGGGAGDALDLAVPQRLARQRLHAGVKQRELDARRAAVEHEDQVAHGGSTL